MPPESVPSKMGVLGMVVTKPEPKLARSLLVASISIMIGHIPDEKWEQMINTKTTPCAMEGCNCHLIQDAFMLSLIPIREIYKLAKEPEGEKGLAE